MRPDIAFAVYKATLQRTIRASTIKSLPSVSCYTQNVKFCMTPMKSAQKILNLESYSDTDFGADKMDRKSLIGGVIL